jgi:hypothetical protein
MVVTIAAAFGLVNIATASSDPMPATATTTTSPANQPSLDIAADDASAIAGESYFSNAVVNDDANTVTLYLAGAPQTIVDQLESAHPATYLIDNTAAYPASTILALEDTISGQISDFGCCWRSDRISAPDPRRAPSGWR